MWNQAAEAAAAAAAAAWEDGWDEDACHSTGLDGQMPAQVYAEPMGNGCSGCNGCTGCGCGGCNGYGAQMYEDLGFNGYVPQHAYYQENMAMANMNYGMPQGDVQPPSADPQVQWWVQKFDERAQSTGAYKLRSVGSMRPTNLGPTQPKGCRNKAREQRVKFQDQRLIPDVPRPLRPPSDMGLAMDLAELEKSKAVPGLGEVRQVIRESFDKAYEAVIVAARAHEEMCRKTEQLKNNPDAVEKLKRAKICTRDVLLWRWFGLTAWIYNQAESEFFQAYGREIESQLMNSVAKIRQRLMQDLMLRPCWKKLEKKLVNCASSNNWTPEFQGLLNRFRFIFDSLGGPRNPELQEFRVLEDEQKMMQEMAELDEKERQVEEEFAAEVWNHAGRKVTESVVGFLGLDDDEDDPFPAGLLPMLDEELQNNHDDTAGSSTELPPNATGGFGEEALEQFTAIQHLLWELQQETDEADGADEA